MRQLIFKASFQVGFISASGLIGFGGQGNASLLQAFAPDSAKQVVPVAGVFRSLTVTGPGSHPTCVITLRVNGVASAITCTLDTAGSTASDRTHEVTVLAGDDVSFAVALTPAGGNPGSVVNLSLEFEGDEQWFGVTPQTGSQPAGEYRGGGALGNGQLQNSYVPTTVSNTYSICATPGTLTGLTCKAYSGAPGASHWIGYLSKNAVLQDGTGGTVDTACPMTGTGTGASVRFALPVVVGDRLDLALLRTGSNAAFANAHVALSVSFTPTTPDVFMACGGNNDALTNSAVDWKWTQSEQVGGVEAYAQVPLGPRPLVLTGLYIEKVVQTPGTGKSVIYTIRKNGADTAATCTITGPTATTCQVSGLAIPYQDGDLLDLQLTPVNGPSMGISLAWGIALAPPPPLPPPPPAPPVPIRRLRQAPVLWDGAEGKRLKFPGFELLTEAGGPRDTDVPMPIVLQWSDDGGHSWGHEHRNEGARIGEHRYRYRWLRLGQARNRVFRVVCSADAKVVFIDALLSPDPVQGSS